MIGQIELVNRLNNLTVDSLPKALILLGEYGCGKHLFTSMICEKFNINSEDVINTMINLTSSKDRSDYFEGIETKIQTCTEPTIFVIDSSLQGIDFISIQNKILKLLEDQINPLAHIIIYCTGLNGLLPTIQNRCCIWRFNKYTKEELSQFKNEFIDEKLYNIFNTPGKILSIKSSIIEYINLSEQIFQCIDKAVISNVLILPNKLGYTASDDKLNIDIFIDILKNTALNLYSNNSISFNAFILTQTLSNNIKIIAIDKKKLYERYLIDLKDELKRFKNGN